MAFTRRNTFPSNHQTLSHLSLSGVSKQWQALAVEFLFQQVWVRHGVRGLLECLKGSVQSEGCGRYVRRLELPSTPINDDVANPVWLVDILACCPHLQIIIQPTFYSRVNDLEWWFNPIPTEQPQTNDVVLMSLKFLHWSSCGFGRETIMASHLLLFKIILCALNLCYISVLWLIFPCGLILKEVHWTSHPVLLPSLKTLNFERNLGLNPGIQNGDLPNWLMLYCLPITSWTSSPQAIHPFISLGHSWASQESSRNPPWY